ncbi:MAG: hypothetical protein U9Q29_02975 [Campylobacterota bacterium]|nr:hypothetical protein [Campylobacterota bacterium]
MNNLKLFFFLSILLITTLLGNEPYVDKALEEKIVKKWFLLKKCG